MNLPKRRGFTLIELLVVIAIIGLLSTIAVTALNTARKKSRDTARLADMNSLKKAIELYRTNFNAFPPFVGDTGCGGYDTTADGTFITSLTTANILNKPVKDPTMNTTCGNYRYYIYNAGDNGCPATYGRYYVLGVNNMETSAGAYPGSPGFACSGNNWQAQFEWVTGAYEN